MIPGLRATYRLQFHAGFTLDDAAAIVPVIAGLGISHVYASPLLTARRGSTHGYDGIDPARINPELGGWEAFERFRAALRAQGLGLILDIVPNHMAVGPENAWWMSVLAEGPDSPHAAAFDIDWERGGGKVLLPVLGDPYGEVLERGEIQPAWDAETGRFVARCFETAFPLREGSLPEDLARAVAEERLTPEGAAETLRVRPGDAATVESWHAVLERQHWRLAWWRTAAQEINFRRFFEIDALVGVRVERPDVFDATHAFIVDLVRQAHVQGLRIDHIDGLADPGLYLRELRARVGPEVPILVEKILGAEEDLPDWPVEGTTGYEALNWLDGLLLDRAGRGAMRAAYASATGDVAPMAEHVEHAKRFMLQRAFVAEREAILDDLAALARSSAATRDFARPLLAEALDDLLVAFDVYRTYRTDGPVSPVDRAVVSTALARATAMTGAADTRPHGFVAGVLLGDLAEDADMGALRARIVRRIQQLSGPVMAKSLEDTAFYRSAPLLALNEVGGEPDAFGLDIATFHRRVADRGRRWPQALVATTTHDTKRSEDARARLLVLTRDPGRWAAAIAAFEAGARALVGLQAGGEAPDATDRIILLQAILGSWPLEAIGERPEGEVWAQFGDRVGAFALKAIREAKRHTAWTRQRPDYEAAVQAFVAGLFVPRHEALSVLLPLVRDIARQGAAASLVRTVLKATMPGVPDFYQGTELWDFSMVDPDNRRPVDYAARAKALAEEPDLESLAETWWDGRIKLHVTRRLLRDRAEHPRLYATGSYEPWGQSGLSGILAVVRRSGGDARLVLARPAVADWPAEGDVASQHEVRLPPGLWRNLLTGTEAEGSAPLATLLDRLPAGVFAWMPH